MSDVWRSPMWDASAAELVDVWQRSKLVCDTLGGPELRHELGQDLAHTFVDQRFTCCRGEAGWHGRTVVPPQLELVRCLSADRQ